MKTTACINEIFSSLQGEGSYAGEKMTFVRFANCSLGCKWCDTNCAPANVCEVYTDDDQVPSVTLTNPLNIVTLNETLKLYDNDIVTITGGEPLEEVEFLTNWLPEVQRNHKVLLETNGIYYNELKKVKQFIDIISMDIKLPSSTGQRPLWKEHKKFLKAGLESNKELYIKLVVTSSTTDVDINEAIKLVSSTNRYVNVYIQPVSSHDAFSDAISEEKVSSFKRLIGAWLPNVTVSPQMHKEWGIR